MTDLAGRIARVVQDLCGPGASAELDGVLARPAASDTALMVVGDPGSGRSSVVAALLGCPALRPPPDSPPSCAAVVVRHAAQEGARAWRDGDAAAVAIGLADVPAWAAGRHGDDVHLIEAELPSPLLATGLVVVDTPGTGGPGSAAVLAALGDADAVLVVTESEAPLSEAELARMSSASSRVAALLLALSKIDRSPGWRAIWQADRAILRARADDIRVASMLPVSARLSFRAEDLAPSDPALARELWREGGVEALRTAVRREVVGRGATIRVLNAARVAAGALDRAADAAALVLASPAESEELTAELEERQRAWQELGRATASWQSELSDRMQELRLAMADELTRATTELSRAAETALAQPRADPDAVLTDLEEGLRSMVLDLHGSLARAVATLADDLVARLGLPRDTITPGDGEPGGEDGPTVSLAPGAAAASTPPPVLGLLGPVAIPVSLTTSLAAFVGIGFAAAFPVGLLAGGILAGFVTAHRRRAVRRQDARAVVRATVAEVSGALRNDIARRIVGVQRVIRDELRLAFERRAEEIKAALESHRSTLAEDRQARAGARASAEASLAEVGELRRELDALVHEGVAGGGG